MVEDLGSIHYHWTFWKFIPRDTTTNTNCGIILAITLYITFANLQIGYNCK